MLPDLGTIDVEELRGLRAAGLTPARVRELTSGPDTLLKPLEPTRECLYSDDPVCTAVRKNFCDSAFHIRYVRDLLIVSDFLTSDTNAVMGAGETTGVLYRAASCGRRIGRVLDLGCGAGTVGLLLAAEADHVTATDINPRAVQLARLNAILNNITNFASRTGNLFEPVNAERFDLIVSQPPYYPGSGQVFLHGGPCGHEIAERIVRGVPRFLSAQGKAIIHASWPIEWEAPLIQGCSLTEYTPGTGEVPGTRHSLVVVERGDGVRRVDVPPERWGSLSGL
jgi:SAM-dependent methyltransferase